MYECHAQDLTTLPFFFSLLLWRDALCFICNLSDFDAARVTENISTSTNSLSAMSDYFPTMIMRSKRWKKAIIVALCIYAEFILHSAIFIL